MKSATSTSFVFVLVLCGAGAAIPLDGELSDVRFSESSELNVWRVELPGRLEASTSYCRDSSGANPESGAGPEDRECDLFLLIRFLSKNEDSEARRRSARAVYRLPLSPHGRLVEVARFAPVDEDRRFGASHLSPTEAAGQLRLFLSLRGRGYWIDIGGRKPGEHSPRPVIELSEEEPWRSLSLPRVSVASLGSPLVTSVDVGRLDVFHWRKGSFHKIEHRLPVQVERKKGLLTLTSPPVRPVMTDRLLFAVGPEEHGHLRLRTLLLDPLAPEVDPSRAPSNERWSMLPGIERLVGSEYFSVDGRLMLGVVTLRADKIGILERKKLRLFELRADRTRAGSRPFFETLTASRLWQELGVDLLDADGDGTLDLVLTQPEGMAGKKLAIDLYPGRARRGAEGGPLSSSAMAFEAKPIRSLIKVPGAWWSYGDDWSGDGIPDLLSLASGTLRLFEGAVPSKRGFLSEEPAWHHEVEAPERMIEEEGEKEEERPRRRAEYRDGVLWVRSTYTQGPDLLEVLMPRDGATVLKVASFSSTSF